MLTINGRRRGAFARTEVLVLTLLLALLAGAGQSAVQRSWETSNRVKCGSNLRQIGQAMRQYAIDDVRGGNYPRTVYDAETAHEPKFATPYANDSKLGPHEAAEPFATAQRAEREQYLLPSVPYTPQPNDVTAAFWHLLRQTDLTPDVFICPSTRRTGLAFPAGASKQSYTNWPGTAALRDHLSYSFQNMYWSMEAVGRGAKWTDGLSSTYVLAADMNPGNESVVKMTLAEWRPQNAAPSNSTNHFGEGQNIMFADGSVRFDVSPFVGPQRDNIYAYRTAGDPQQQAGDLPSAGVGGTAFDPRDIVLLPAAEQIDQPAVAMPAPDEIEQLQAQERQREKQQLVDDPEKLFDAAELFALQNEPIAGGADEWLDGFTSSLEQSAQRGKNIVEALTQTAADARARGEQDVAERAARTAADVQRTVDDLTRLVEAFRRVAAERRSSSTKPS